MKAIVAVDNNWAIGKGGDLLFNIKADLQHFKALTTNKAVIMGRKTFESLPNKTPLPNRDNYILTRDENYKVENTTVVNSYQDFIDNVSTKYSQDEIFVIGGEEVYKLFYDNINIFYVTKIYDTVYDADKFMYNLDLDVNFKIFNQSKIQIDRKTGLKYKFLEYKKER